MKFGLAVLLLLGLALTISSTVQPVSAARSKGLTKLLDEILKKLDEFSKAEKSKLKQLASSHKGDVAKSNKELAALRAEYLKEKKENEILKDEDQKSRDVGAAALLRLEQQVAKERRLVAKIKSMLRHEIGTDASHAAKNCDEIFQDLTVGSGSYWVLKDGKPVKVRCVRAEDSTKVLSVGCASSRRGKSGWADVCLDTVEFNSAPELFKVVGTKVQVLRKGIYVMRGTAQNYCSGYCSRNSRILVNGKSIDYNHCSREKNTMTMINDVTWSLNKNDKVSFNVHAHGSDPWTWKSMKEGDPRNRFQISFVGDSETPHFSGGCSGHRRSSGWQRLCLNSIEQNSGTTKQHLDHYKDGRVMVKKAAYYRITASAMGHSNSGHHYLRVLINGVNREYTYNAGNGWRQQQLDLTWPLKEDDTVEIYAHCNGGNPYTWHSHSTAGHTARISITKVSDITGKESVKYIMGGPAGHYRGSAWRRYYVQKVGQNSMPTSLVTYTSGGVFTMKKNSWVRVNALGNLHTSGEQPKYGKILVNGKIVSTAFYESSRQWQTLNMDYTFPAMKGDKVEVYWRAAGGNPYLHLYNPRSGEGLLEFHAL